MTLFLNYTNNLTYLAYLRKNSTSIHFFGLLKILLTNQLDYRNNNKNRVAHANQKEAESQPLLY